MKSSAKSSNLLHETIIRFGSQASKAEKVKSLCLDTWPKADQKALTKLRANAEGFLKYDGKRRSKSPTIRSQGRSYRPATKSQNLIIAAVPASKLGEKNDHSASDDGVDEVETVYIHYGHGSHGILLGMGSGRLMAQILLG